MLMIQTSIQPEHGKGRCKELFSDLAVSRLTGIMGITIQALFWKGQVGMETAFCRRPALTNVMVDDHRIFIPED